MRVFPRNSGLDVRMERFERYRDRHLDLAADRRIAILHPALDESKGGSGIRDRVDPDTVALEGLHESLGHAVALGAFRWGEAGNKVKRQGDLG